MFCTGGIRCEKSTAYLRSQGFDDVYHLEGGILRYLETVAPEESRWEGECFVFDERVSVRHGLAPGSYALCRRSEEHSSELQPLMRRSYAVFCLKQNKYNRSMTRGCRAQRWERQ